MYAIVEIGGMQYKVAESATVCVPKMEQEPGKKVDFDRVLMIVDEDNINMGTPVVANAVVKATVVSQFKDDKVLVFKKKRRKNYKVLRGHRQQLTEIKIDAISLGGSRKAKTEASEEKAPKAAGAGKPAAAVKKTTAKPKAAAAKKPAAKKPAAAAKAKKAPSKPSEKKEA